MIMPVALLFLLAGCETEEGEGGSSVITGKVYKKVYNNSFTAIIDEYYVPDEDVFIIYGSDDVYGDDMETSFDGSYRFEYLKKGDYTLFVYSDDTSGNKMAEIPVTKTISITKNKQLIKVEDIIIADKSDYDDGSGTITGKVFAVDYNAEMTNTPDYYYIADERVYIVYGDDSVHFDDVRTHHDGSFKFRGLVNGIYTVYALSKDYPYPNNPLIPVSDTIEITPDNPNVIITEDIIIIK